MYHFTIAAEPKVIHIPGGICITLGWQQQHQEYYISLQNRAKCCSSKKNIIDDFLRGKLQCFARLQKKM
jgi:hypothetical protein